jgi:hypothetical protein
MDLFALYCTARAQIWLLICTPRNIAVPDQVLVLLKDTSASRRVPNVFAQGRMRVEYDVVQL